MGSRRRFIDTYVKEFKPAPENSRPSANVFWARINRIIDSLKTDSDATDLFQEMILDCSKYVNAVVEYESIRMTGKIMMEPDDYWKRVEELDRGRSIAHNRLIDSVRAFNRICSERDIEIVFKCDLDDRAKVAYFAEKIVHIIFVNRKK